MMSGEITYEIAGKEFNKREDAVKFLLREQESITRDAVDKLKKSMKEEGYDLENIEK